MSNKRGKPRGGCLSSTTQAAGGAVEGAVLAGRLRGQQGGGGSPASLRPEQCALALALWMRGRGALGDQGGQRRHGRRGRPGLLLHQGLRLGVAVSWRTGDTLLLPPPGVVVSGVTDVVVDEGVGLLSALVHLIFTVAAL